MLQEKENLLLLGKLAGHKINIQNSITVLYSCNGNIAIEVGGVGFIPNSNKIIKYLR